MSSAKPESAALTVLRALFDLADVDLQATPEVLGRLLDHPPARLAALLAQLRRAGLVQLDHLRLTMAGLVLATALPETQPSHRASPAPAPRRRLRAA